MRKYILPACGPVGLMIYLIYRIGSHYMVISDIVVMPAFVISIVLMLVGVAYSGWYWGRRVTLFYTGEDKKTGNQEK